jgi:chromosome partitioning protein
MGENSRTHWEEHMPRIISITGQKGGVGKTTSTVHIASRLADLGYKTLIIDFDTTQSNATRSIYGPVWDWAPEDKVRGICDVVANGGKLDDIIFETGRENLWIVPSEKKTPKGTNYNIEGSLNQMGLEGFSVLKELFDESSVLTEMHFVLIDNAPSLGITTVSSMIASDYFLIPVQTSDLSMESIGDTITAGLKVKKQMNEYLEPLGFFISTMDKRPKMAKAAIIELESLAKETNIHFFNTKIPTSAKFAFLPREQKTIFDVTKKSARGHKEYLDLVSELLDQIKRIETGEVKGKSQNIRMEV